MKKVQDHYFKRAQKEGYPARSVYKLEEAQKKYQLLKKGDKVLDLGCHPGSWSMYAAKVAGAKGVVIGVDLNEGKKIHISGAASVTRLCADIMGEDIFEILSNHCSKFNTIVSDIAPRTTGNKWSDQQSSLNLSRRVFEIAQRLLKDGGNFYCKVFEGEDFKEFVQEVRRSFKMTKIFKPDSSRKESREVFVLGKGFISNRSTT